MRGRRGRTCRLPAVLFLGALAASGSGCGDDNSVDSQPQAASVTVTLRWNGPRYAGGFYSSFLPATDYAVWIESSTGEHVKTLAVTPTVVSVGEYSHLDHLPEWTASTDLTYTDLESETDRGVAPSFDALTRASVLFAPALADTTLSFGWDLQSAEGVPADRGRFRFCAEVANIAKDDASAYEILAECACGQIDLDAFTVTPATPTQHILELSAQLHEAPAD